MTQHFSNQLYLMGSGAVEHPSEYKISFHINCHIRCHYVIVCPKIIPNNNVPPNTQIKSCSSMIRDKGSSTKIYKIFFAVSNTLMLFLRPSCVLVAVLGGCVSEPWRGVTIIERQLVSYNGGQLRAIYNWTGLGQPAQYLSPELREPHHQHSNINTLASLLVTLFCIVNKHNEHQSISMTWCPGVRLGRRNDEL